jgi:hypothetical protein
MRHSSLGRRTGRSPTDPEVIEKMGARAYHEHGIVVFRLDSVRDDWRRQVMINEAEARWGKRPTGSPDPKA